jgi:predicted nucleic acid-binding protein
MYEVVLLDSGPLGLLVNEPAALRKPLTDWTESLAVLGRRLVLPESSDYEIRRELLRLTIGPDKPRWAVDGIARLDRLCSRLTYYPISTTIMRRAAELWAEARRRGRPAAPDEHMDFDMILAAMAQVVRDQGFSVVVATDNVRHFLDFIDARPWHDISAA